MKIEFTGTGGTGKTTTALMVAEALGLEILPSVARGVYEERGWTEAELPDKTPEERHSLQCAIFEAHLKQLDKFKDHSYVADRSLICRLAYSLLNDGPMIGNPDLAFMVEATRLCSRNVDLTVYFPMPHWDIKDDHFRLNSLAASVALDALTVGLLQTYGIPAMTAHRGTAENRCLQITTAARLMSASKRDEPRIEVVRDPIRLG